MIVRQYHITRIQDQLAFLKCKVELAGSLNLTDIHIYAEDFYKDLFNKFGYSFRNGNFDKQNCAFIDLIDDVNRIVIQVTSRNDSDKISEAIVGFRENPDNAKYKDYSFKVLLISKRVKDYRVDFTSKGKYDFDHKRDVIDIERLTAKIKDRTIEEMLEISKFLDKEILLPRSETESNELETIMSLLSFLSDDKNYKDLDEVYVCDPEQKINCRFKDYADDFKDEYTELCPIYYNTIDEAKKTFGLDGVRAQKISFYLKIVSNSYLRESNDNPQKALDSLTDYLEKKLNTNGIPVDKCAIRYYLLEELIGCNIFSTKKE